jgi:formylglycine-generating enzyme required for sulfatase activity
VNPYDPGVNPGADEVCGDGVDNNCDGNIDEGCGAVAVSGAVVDDPVVGSNVTVFGYNHLNEEVFKAETTTDGDGNYQVEVSSEKWAEARMLIATAKGGEVNGKTFEEEMSAALETFDFERLKEFNVTPLTTVFKKLTDALMEKGHKQGDAYRYASTRIVPLLGQFSEEGAPDIVARIGSKERDHYNVVLEFALDTNTNLEEAAGVIVEALQDDPAVEDNPLNVIETYARNPFREEAEKRIRKFASDYLLFNSALRMTPVGSEYAPLVSYTARQSQTAGGAIAELGMAMDAVSHEYQVAAYKKVLIDRLMEQIQETHASDIQELDYASADLGELAAIFGKLQTFFDTLEDEIAVIDDVENGLKKVNGAFSLAFDSYHDESGGLLGGVNNKAGHTVLRLFRRLLYLDTYANGKQVKYVTFANCKKRMKRMGEALKIVGDAIDKLSKAGEALSNLTDLAKKKLMTHMMFYVVGHTEALNTLDMLRDSVLLNGPIVFTAGGSYPVTEDHPLIVAIDELVNDLDTKNGLMFGFDWAGIITKLKGELIDRGTKYLLTSVVKKSAKALGVKSTAIVGQLVEMAKDVADQDIKASRIAFTDAVYNGSIIYYGFRDDFTDNVPDLLDPIAYPPEIRVMQVNLLSAQAYYQMQMAQIFARSYLTREGSIDDKFLEIDRWGFEYDIDWANDGISMRGYTETVDLLVRNLLAKKGVVNAMTHLGELLGDEGYEYFGWVEEVTGRKVTLQDMTLAYSDMQLGVKLYMRNAKNLESGLFLEGEGYYYYGELGENAAPYKRFVLKRTGNDIIIDSLKTSYLGASLDGAPQYTRIFDLANLPQTEEDWENGVDLTFNRLEFFDHGWYETEIEYHLGGDRENPRYASHLFFMPKTLTNAPPAFGSAITPQEGDGYYADFDMVIFTGPADANTQVCLDVSDVVHRISPRVAEADWTPGGEGDEWHYAIVKTDDESDYSYTRLLSEPVGIGDLDPEPAPTAEEDDRICVTAVPSVYYLATYRKVDGRVVAVMPVKVFTDVIQGEDEISFKFADEMLADSDGDGMPDAWENAYELDPDDPADAAVDSDGDGTTNLEEYENRTDPTVMDGVVAPDSPTGVTAEAGDGNATVSWDPADSAVSYRIYMAEESGVSSSNYTGLSGGQRIPDVSSPHVVGGLANGTAYYFVVTSVGANGDESHPESDEVNATPREAFAGETITDDSGLGMTFNLIPAGTFTMGSPDTETGSYDRERPQHEVTISQDFYIMTTEVTQAQWTEVMGSNPSYFDGCGGDCPVEKVSWDDIQEFITTLNALDGRTYRLPTEAEWEYAARAGTTTAFYNGDITNTSCDDPKLDAIGWYCGNADSTTHPVGQKQPNAWGLFDMSGNVWEWVEDDWHSSYDGAPTDGSAWVDSPRASRRVFRGGGWSSVARYCRSARRDGNGPTRRSNRGGFRLALSPGR